QAFASGRVERERLQGAGELVGGAGGEFDTVGDVDDLEQGVGADRCRGLGGGASVHPGAALLDDAAGMAAGPGQTGGEQGDVEAVAVHRSAGTGAGAGWVRSRPVQALSPLCSRSRASTARSTRGSSCSPWTAMSPSSQMALTAPQRARSPSTTGSGNGAAIRERSGRMTVGRRTG